MTSPARDVVVRCPRVGCGTIYSTWHRASINLTLGEEFSDEYLHDAMTGTCPRCRYVVDLGMLTIVQRGGRHVWQFVPAAFDSEAFDQTTPGLDL